MASFDLKIGSTPEARLAYTNKVYVSQGVFVSLAKESTARGISVSASDPVVNVAIGKWVFLASPHPSMMDGDVGLNSLQRKTGQFTLNQAVHATVFIPSADVAVSEISIAVDLISKKKDAGKVELNVDQLSDSFITQFGSQVFCAGQELAMDFNSTKLSLIVDGFDHAAVGVSTKKTGELRGQVLPVSKMSWKKQIGSQTNIVFAGVSAGMERNDSLFRSDFDFTKMGIGGLGDQFQLMFRRAFASRIFPGLVKQLGINHIRGILLHGPPGCGKTLIARQIGKILNAREPKIINGPEVLDKFVGKRSLQHPSM
jgi:vesicle-fusing ATPase